MQLIAEDTSVTAYDDLLPLILESAIRQSSALMEYLVEHTRIQISTLRVEQL